MQKHNEAEPMDDIRQPGKPSKPLGMFFELTEVLCSAVLAIAVLFTFAMRFAGVLGQSMMPTLHNRDWLSITANWPTPKRGAIVIINSFHEPLVKRVVAIEGDVVDIKEGRLWINGAAVDEPYLPEGRETEPAPWHDAAVEYPAAVPRGKVFVLGDNRGASMDSRFADVGLIRVDDILGRVLFRLRSTVAGSGFKVN